MANEVLEMFSFSNSNLFWIIQRFLSI